jgi:hypothetical protein
VTTAGDFTSTAVQSSAAVAVASAGRREGLRVRQSSLGVDAGDEEHGDTEHDQGHEERE